MNMPRNITFIIIIAATLVLISAPAASLAQRPEPQASASDRFERGKRLYEQGDTEAAIAELRAAAEAHRDDADAWYFLGLALNSARQHKEARKAFETTLKLRPDDAPAHAWLAYTLLRLSKPNDAEREAQSALKLDPKLAEAHYVVGVLRYADDKFPAAAEEAEEALRLKPEYPAAAYLLSEALLDIYSDELQRLAAKYPSAPDSGADERKAALEKRDAELAPLRARMLDAASRLEAFAKLLPKSPDAEAWREQAGSLRFYGHAGGSASGVFNQADVMRRAVILFKPEPQYTDEARNNHTSGVVRLRAVLSADGQVRNIIPIKRLPDGLTEKAIEAAKQIRFTPASVNGQPVSQFIIVEYNFYVGIRR